MSRKIKALVVIGTRPEVIKMAPVINMLKSHKDIFSLKVCVSGQHKEMLYQALEQFDIEPDIDLSVMSYKQSLVELISKILLGINIELTQDKPDVVLVHGDTTTALTVSIACFNLGIKVAHVEAGLRTHDLKAPFPEEFNRRVVALATETHFAPTEQAKINLLKEGVPEGNIYVTGNTVIDALLLTLKKIELNSSLKDELYADLNKILGFDFTKKKYVLITGHRRENFGKGMNDICTALVDLAEKHSLVSFVYPVHLNPNVRQPVTKLLRGRDNIHLIEPVAYQHFSLLLKHSYIILTDSGGIQEEAPSLGKPVLVMRDVTERPEALAAGTVKLVSSDSVQIINGVSDLLTCNLAYQKMSAAYNPYGDGKAADKIISILSNLYRN
jgi:UDP-N-acetylglucosamine 2-epimerase (non-hydrolysing)